MANIRPNLQIMDDILDDKESLVARIQQLEYERNELQKDIEQLCMQQAGTSYLGVATRMHFQRTAGLEEEIESLKKKLIACSREKLNLQDELSEASRIKTQLADLHAAEVAKNLEAEKQLKFFQGCVASAFAERDQSLMEAEKAKEKEEFMSEKLNEIEKRLEDLTSGCLEQKKLNDKLQADQAMLLEQYRNCKEVVEKFYGIRHNSFDGFEEISLDSKLECLIQDPVEMWNFNGPSTLKYASALEEELEKVRSSVDNLQNNLRMGLKIKSHLKKKLHQMEKKKIFSDKLIMSKITDLRQYHSQERACIMHLLREGGSDIKSIGNALEEQVRQLTRRQHSGTHQDVKLDEHECRDVHITTDVECNLVTKSSESHLCDSVPCRKGDTSNAQVSQEKSSPPHLLESMAYKLGNNSEILAQALQEKVSALLLLSQQDERHLLEKNVNAALQKKIEELHRNLLQVTNEKVKALVELAWLKQENHLLQEKLKENMELVKTGAGERGIASNSHDSDGRLKNILKKTYLKRWIGPVDESGALVNTGVKFSDTSSGGVDYARMKVENATLKESLESIVHLTTSIRRLRVALFKVKDSVDSEDEVSSTLESVNSIISEASLLKTAFGNSLPISWSAEIGNETDDDNNNNNELSTEKIDSVTAAGLEMVELVIFAAQILKNITVI